MSLEKALKNLKFDVRMTEHNLNHSVITKEELQTHLKSLPDLASNSEQINLEGEGRRSSSSSNEQLN